MALATELHASHAAVARSPLASGVRLVPGLPDPASRGAAIERGLERLWGRFEIGHHEGPAALVEPQHFVDALRDLASGLLEGASGEVEVSAANELWPALYPEQFGLEPAPPPHTLGDPPDGLVVIVGVGRSGTTWLERLLMAHPRAGGAEATESFLFEQFRPLFDEVRRGPELGLDDAGVMALLRRFADTVFAATFARHRPAATVMVEKTPLHSLIVPEIHRIYPDAFFVHLLRDGREVARSVSEVPFFQCPTPADGAALWNRTVRRLQHVAPSITRWREVRYEDLRADPSTIVCSLWDWIGLPELDEARRRLDARIAERVSTHAGTEHALGSESWRSLSRPQIAGMYAEAGPLLVDEGYASADDLRQARRQLAYWRRRLERSRRERHR